MLPRILSWLLKLGAGGIVERAITLIEHRTDALTDREKIKANLTAEYLRQVISEQRVLADFNTAKLSFPWFWILVSLFIGPLAFWWCAVIVDSVFGFSWDIANLPTADMRAWAGDMIRWLFYVGTGAGALKAVLPK